MRVAVHDMIECRLALLKQWERTFADLVDKKLPEYLGGGSNFEIESLYFAPMPKISLGVL